MPTSVKPRSRRHERNVKSFDPSSWRMKCWMLSTTPATRAISHSPIAATSTTISAPR